MSWQCNLLWSFSQPLGACYVGVLHLQIFRKTSDQTLQKGNTLLTQTWEKCLLRHTGCGQNSCLISCRRMLTSENYPWSTWWLYLIALLHYFLTSENSFANIPTTLAKLDRFQPKRIPHHYLITTPFLLNKDVSRHED